MSASPPPTPPSRFPRFGESRFKPFIQFCEPVDNYRPGGFHPVALGDVFNDGQYKVIRKLGDGSYSTVWLARDLKNNMYVALKIHVSDTPTSTTELQNLRYMTRVASTEGGQHITQLLGEFDHHGPNGIHKCLVLEPMGPSADAMLLELPQFKPRKRHMKFRYPPQMAKAILKQALQALVVLHENGIAHGDLQLGNMLFVLDDINSVPEDVLRQEENEESWSISPPVQRLDGKQDKWSPPYLCNAQPLAPYSSHSEGFKIKLSDLGGAYFFTGPSPQPVNPLEFRTPEVILTGAINNTLDIWCFGCLIFEIITGLHLFEVQGSGSVDDAHLLSFTTQLGALPDELFKHWKNSSLYFTPEKEIYNLGTGELWEEPTADEMPSMEERFDECQPDLTEEEASKVKALIRRILQYDPAKRPSAAEILSDPWFCDIQA